MYMYLASQTPWLHRVRRWLLVIVYFTAYLCHLLSAPTDERISILYDRSSTWYTNTTLVELELGSELTEYYNLNIARLSCLGLGWILAVTLYAPRLSSSAKAIATTNNAEKSPLLNVMSGNGTGTTAAGDGTSSASSYPTASYDNQRAAIGPPARDNADTARTLTFAPDVGGGSNDIEMAGTSSMRGSTRDGNNLGTTGTLGWGNGTGVTPHGANAAGTSSIRGTGSVRSSRA
jgi:hypothetical protein